MAIQNINKKEFIFLWEYKCETTLHWESKPWNKQTDDGGG